MLTQGHVLLFLACGSVTLTAEIRYSWNVQTMESGKNLQNGRRVDGSDGIVRVCLPAYYCPWVLPCMFPSQICGLSAGQLLALSQPLASFHRVRLCWPEMVSFPTLTVSNPFHWWDL